MNEVLVSYKQSLRNAVTVVREAEQLLTRQGDKMDEEEYRLKRSFIYSIRHDLHEIIKQIGEEIYNVNRQADTKK